MTTPSQIIMSHYIARLRLALLKTHTH